MHVKFNIRNENPCVAIIDITNYGTEPAVTWAVSYWYNGHLTGHSGVIHNSRNFEAAFDHIVSNYALAFPDQKLDTMAGGTYELSEWDRYVDEGPWHIPAQDLDI